MSNVQPEPNPQPASTPSLVPIGPSPPWVIILGAAFGGTTLIFFLIFVLIAGLGHATFICDSFQLLAGVFAFGAGLSAAFLGGGAAAQGSLGNAAQNRSLAFSAGGGVAVLVIAFFIFSTFKPDNCNKAADLELEFHGIPNNYSVSLDSFFSQPTYDSSTGLLPTRKFIVLIRDRASQSSLIIQDPKGTIVCAVPILSYTAVNLLSVDLGKQYDLEHGNLEIAGNPVKFIFVEPSASIKAGPRACFKYERDNKATYVVAGVAHFGRFAYGKATKQSTVTDGPIDPTDVPAASSENRKKTGQIDSVGDSFAFLGSAWNPISASLAQDVTHLTPFIELKGALSSHDPAIRITARQYLERNFSDYANNVLHDLFIESQDPLYVESILYGLVVGIDVASGGALKPGKRRDLSLPLPYVEGKEMQIVNLTAHPAEGVSKQARRLIQRFPVNAFDTIYQRLLTNSESGTCREDDRMQGLLYGSIFFEYNRIVENYYGDPSKKAIDDLEARAQKIRKMAAKCLSQELAVDAALVDYGRAVVYARWSNYKAQAVEAAKQFLLEIQGREDSYYLTSHITRMQQLVNS